MELMKEGALEAKKNYNFANQMKGEQLHNNHNPGPPLKNQNTGAFADKI